MTNLIDVGPCRSERALFSMRPLALALSLLTLGALASCAHQPPAPPPIETFHYRASAKPVAVGEPWRIGLNGNLPTHFAGSVHFNLPETGTLKLTTDCVPSRVAVLVYTSGQKPLAQARAGATLTTPLVKGDVFVVIRALKGSGPVRVQLTSEFVPAEAGAAPAPPTTAATVTPDLEIEMAGAKTSDSDELPLDNL